MSKEVATLTIDNKAIKGKGVGSQWLQEFDLLRGIEDSYLILVMDDLLIGNRIESSSVINLNVFDKIEKYPVNVVSNGEQLVTHEEFLQKIRSLLSTEDVVWVDTDKISFEWSDLHDLGIPEVLSKLSSTEFTRGNVAIRRKGSDNDYLTFRIIR